MLSQPKRYVVILSQNFPSYLSQQMLFVETKCRATFISSCSKVRLGVNDAIAKHIVALGFFYECHSLIHSFVHSFIRSFIHSFLHSFIHSFIPSFIHSFIPSFIYSLIHQFLPSFIHAFIHPFIPSFIHAFIHSFIHSTFDKTAFDFFNITGAMETCTVSAKCRMIQKFPRVWSHELIRVYTNLCHKSLL